MAFRENIVVTGVGVVSPTGIGAAPFWTALIEGRSGIRPLGWPSDPRWPEPVGGVVIDFDPKQYVRPRKSLKVMSRDIQLGFTAADLACVEAGIKDRPIDPERFGVVFGATLIPCEAEELVSAYRGCTVEGEFRFDRWGHTAMVEMYPLWMLKYLPNMPACHIGIAQDARGPNNTVTLGDVSTVAAMNEALHVLQRGQADAIISGGTCSRHHMAVWVRSHAYGLSRNDGFHPRPFDARRDGLANGEGSATLFLEREEKATARGAQPIARVLGGATAFTPCKNAPEKRGDAICRAIRGALQDAGVSAADVGLLVAHGLGTIDEDRIEAQAIRATLGDVPVTAGKGAWGHLGAAAGSLEAALAVLALQNKLIPPTLNFEQPDPECPVNVVHGQPAPLEKPVAVVISHSRHGQAAALVLGAA